MYERNYHSKAASNARDKKNPGGKKGSSGGFRVSRTQWIIIGASIAFVLLLVGLFMAIRSPKLQITNIVVQGAAVTNQSDVVERVQQLLQGKKLRYIPRSSVIAVSTRSLARSIEAAFPRFETVSVSRRGAHTLQVSATEYKSKYLWCKDAEASDAHCFFMDTQGVVFAPAPVFSGSIYPKLFGGTGDAVIAEQAEFAADVPFVAFEPFAHRSLDVVDAIIGQFHVFGMQPVEFHFDAPHALRVVCARGSSAIDVLFDPTMDTALSLASLDTALHAPAMAGTLRGNSQRALEYVDVRFEGKVVYKFKD